MSNPIGVTSHYKTMFRATPDSPAMFQSRIIDVFSRTHFLVVPLLFVPAVIALAAYSISSARVSGLDTALLIGAGALTWTFVEYVAHRLVFHWEAPGPWGQRLHFLIHGVHHQWPNDRYRLVMPPAVSIFLFVTFLWLFSALMGRFGWAFHGGFTLGYMYYDLTHYYLHHGRPRNPYLRRLRKHHMIHHFKGSGSRFGVSSKFWDYVFQTSE